jgi:hypothetical protein
MLCRKSDINIRDRCCNIVGVKQIYGHELVEIMALVLDNSQKRSSPWVAGGIEKVNRLAVSRYADAIVVTTQVQQMSVVYSQASN